MGDETCTHYDHRVTTPDTAAVRAWAKDNGMTVSDRGRLPADLHAAYLAANGGSAEPGPARGAAKPAAAKRKAAGKATADQPPGRSVAVDEPAEVAVAAPAKKATQRKAAAKPSAGKKATGSKATGSKRTAKATGTRGRTASPAAEPARDGDALTVVEQEATEYVTPERDAEAPSAEPTPSPESSPEVARLIALEVQLSALAGRVAALEQAPAAPPPKQSRFRRRS